MIIDLQVVMFFHDAEIRTVFTFPDNGDGISGRSIMHVDLGIVGVTKMTFFKFTQVLVFF